MPVSYPNSVKTFTSLTDGMDNVLAAHHNDNYAETTAIETELGTNPKTITDGTAPAASPTSVAQYLDMVATALKTIMGSANWYTTAAAIMKAIGTAKGDLITFTGSGVSVRQGVGADTQILVSDSAQTNGIKWAFPTLNLSDGEVINGKISPSVSSGSITLALKTLAGNDPSTSSPVYFQIGNAIRTVSTTLSVTVSAGSTNPFNAGSAELGTKEIDFFPCFSYVSTSSAVAIGFSRIPYGRLFSDFSTSSTAEKYAPFSTAPAATDNVINFGRFAATVSTGSTYSWSVPTYTNANLIQAPIRETRSLVWAPVWGDGTMTFTTVTVAFANYQIVGRHIKVELFANGTTGGSATNIIRATLPINIKNPTVAITGAVADGGSFLGGLVVTNTGTPNVLEAKRYDAANFGLGAGRYVNINGTLLLA